MKDNQQNRSRYPALFIILSMSLFFYSCHTYNFSRPQPIDNENIYEFPKEFEGEWISSEYGETVYVGKRHVALIRSDTEKIVAGAWPRLNDKGALIYSPFYNEGLKTIRYDSLRKPIDTITNYLLRGNYIYRVEEKGLLEIGYPYKVEKDTIVIIKNDTISIDIGRNAFLRKLNNEFYVLNINNSIVSDLNTDRDNRWWQIVIFEKKNNQLINIWDLTSVLENQPSMFYNHGDNYYFDCEWTTSDMMNLLNKGHFKSPVRIRRNKTLNIEK